MFANFKNFSLIPSYLFCSVCHEVFKSPVRLPCKHTFCNDCIVKNYKNSRVCPICRKRIVFKNIKPDLTAGCIVNDLDVECLFNGCEWNGKREHSKSHYDECKIKNSNSFYEKNSKSDQNELEINQKNSKNRQNTEALPKKKRKVVDN